MSNTLSISKDRLPIEEDISAATTSTISSEMVELRFPLRFDAELFPEFLNDFLSAVGKLEDDLIRFTERYEVVRDESKELEEIFKERDDFNEVKKNFKKLGNFRQQISINSSFFHRTLLALKEEALDLALIQKITGEEYEERMIALSNSILENLGAYDLSTEERDIFAVPGSSLHEMVTEPYHAMIDELASLKKLYEEKIEADHQGRVDLSAIDKGL